MHLNPKVGICQRTLGEACWKEFQPPDLKHIDPFQVRCRDRDLYPYKVDDDFYRVQCSLDRMQTLDAPGDDEARPHDPIELYWSKKQIIVLLFSSCQQS